MRGDESETEIEEEDIPEEESFEDVILQEHRYGHLQDREWFRTNMLAQRRKLLNSEKGQEEL